MKVGLYTITFLGVWYRGEGLTLEQVIDRAREYGYAGIEIDGKRPHGNPLDLPTRRCLEIRHAPTLPGHPSTPSLPTTISVARFRNSARVSSPMCAS
jgi:hypothetical protein